MVTNNVFNKKYSMTKYKSIVLELLDSTKYLSTNGVVRKVKKEKGRTVNWYLIYHVLKELENEGKVKKIESENGFMWKLRKK